MKKLIYLGISICLFILACNNSPESTNQSKSVDAVSFNYPSSKDVLFKFEGEKSYNRHQPIVVNLIWHNTSPSQEIIMINKQMGFPIGINISIKDQENNELTEFSSKHILSSQLYLGNELKEFEIILEPNEEYSMKVNILDIPIFRGAKNWDKSFLREGQYSVKLFYYKQSSDELIINIR